MSESEHTDFVPNRHADNAEQLLGRNLSAFDLDNTLLKVNCSFKFGTYLFKQGVFSIPTLLRLFSLYWTFRAGFLTMIELHHRVFNLLFIGRSRDLYAEYAEHFLDEHFESFLNPVALKRLRQAQDQNDYICILSSSPDFLVKLFATRLGVLVYKGSGYGVDKKGNFSKISDLVLGETKAVFLEASAKKLNIPKEAIYAYSDSIFDLPFLAAAGRPIGVNPDAKLRKICKEKQWHIL